METRILLREGEWQQWERRREEHWFYCVKGNDVDGKEWVFRSMAEIEGDEEGVSVVE